jgi:hypothetical protein
MITLGSVALLMAVNAGALQATQSTDEKSVLIIVAQALCSTNKSSRILLDSRGAFASPTLQAKFKQIGLNQEFAKLLLDENRGGLIPRGEPYGCLEVTDGSKIEDAFGPKGEASKEGQRWTAFHKVFPGVDGYAAFSMPAFSASGDSAAVYSFYSCGLSCGKGRVYILKRMDRSWTVSKDLPLWDF